MSAIKFRKMNKKQLEDELKKARIELSDVRFDVRVGQEKDYAQIMWKKKEVAQMETVLREKKKTIKKDTSKKEDNKSSKSKDKITKIKLIS